MTHISSTVIHQSLLHHWDEDEYPGVREHFTIKELERLDALKTKTTFTSSDKAFLARMVKKLIFTSI